MYAIYIYVSNIYIYLCNIYIHVCDIYICDIYIDRDRYGYIQIYRYMDIYEIYAVVFPGYDYIFTCLVISKIATSFSTP